MIPPLYGLVLAGGRSSRMRVDKSSLCYQGDTQSEHCFRLLGNFCEKVFISNRKAQENQAGHRGLPQIHDSFWGIGPLGGILSAMQFQSEVAWLVLACDLPYVDHETIAGLVQSRNAAKDATAYHHEDQVIEPLCTIYEPRCRTLLLETYAQCCFSPLKALFGAKIDVLAPADPKHLINANFPEERDRALDFYDRKQED